MRQKLVRALSGPLWWLRGQGIRISPHTYVILQPMKNILWMGVYLPSPEGCFWFCFLWWTRTCCSLIYFGCIIQLKLCLLWSETISFYEGVSNECQQCVPSYRSKRRQNRSFPHPISARGYIGLHAAQNVICETFSNTWPTLRQHTTSPEGGIPGRKFRLSWTS